MKIASRLKLLEEKQRENISIYLHVLIVVSSILSDDISKKKKVEKPGKGAPSATRYFAFPAVFIVTCVPIRSRPPGLYSGYDGIWVRANSAKTAPHPRAFAPDSHFAHIRQTSLNESERAKPLGSLANLYSANCTAMLRVTRNKEVALARASSGSSDTWTWSLMQRMTLSRPLLGVLASRARFARCAAEAVSELVASRHLAAS